MRKVVRQFSVKSAIMSFGLDRLFPSILLAVLLWIPLSYLAFVKEICGLFQFLGRMHTLLGFTSLRISFRLLQSLISLTSPVFDLSGQTPTASDDGTKPPWGINLTKTTDLLLVNDANGESSPPRGRKLRVQSCVSRQFQRFYLSPLPPLLLRLTLSSSLLKRMTSVSSSSSSLLLLHCSLIWIWHLLTMVWWKLERLHISLSMFKKSKSREIEEEVTEAEGSKSGSCNVSNSG